MAGPSGRGSGVVFASLPPRCILHLEGISHGEGKLKRRTEAARADPAHRPLLRAGRALRCHQVEQDPVLLGLLGLPEARPLHHGRGVPEARARPGAEAAAAGRPQNGKRPPRRSGTPSAGPRRSWSRFGSRTSRSSPERRSPSSRMSSASSGTSTPPASASCPTSSSAGSSPRKGRRSPTRPPFSATQGHRRLRRSSTEGSWPRRWVDRFRGVIQSHRFERELRKAEPDPRKADDLISALEFALARHRSAVFPFLTPPFPSGRSTYGTVSSSPTTGTMSRPSSSSRSWPARKSPGRNR